MNKILKLSIWAMVPVLMVSCRKDYLETNPSNDIANTLIFANTTNAKTALEGMYRITYSWAPAVGYASGTLHSDFGQKAYDIVNDLMGNDMVVHSQGYGWFNRDYQYTELLQITDGRRPFTIWTYYYTIINNANNIIVNIDKADGPASDKESMKGQALAIRAYCYYNLINYFQQTYKGNENAKGVPLYTAPATVGLGRGTVQQVYTQIVNDLTAAELLLNGKAAEDKSHIGVRTVQAIRARVALVMEDWPKASQYAALARTGFTPMSTTDYTKGFNDYANPEVLWGAKVIVDQATIYASFFSHMDAQANGGVSYAGLGGQKKITKDLYDQINAADIRKTLFRTPGTGTSGVPDYCQTKFRLPNPSSWAADYLFIRAGEMYLIEAEALARQGNDPGARTALETLVKARFPAYTAAALSGPALLNEILLQRRIELWGEGFSWFDLKRLKLGLNRPTGTGNHGAFNPGQTVLPAGDPLFAYKICQAEFNANLAFTTADQNP
jgi:starch-binding outer membrane protein, SusD/RagB family